MTPVTCSHGRSSAVTSPNSCSSGAATAITSAPMNPNPANHSMEPTRPLTPRKPVVPVRRYCTQLRQPNPSAANAVNNARAATGMSQTVQENLYSEKSELEPAVDPQIRMHPLRRAPALECHEPLDGLVAAVAGLHA